MAFHLLRVSNFLVTLIFAASAIALLPASAAHATNNNAPGNNGTLKVHEKGTPSGTENNDPKVCIFNLEGFGLDESQTGYLMFTPQGGSQPVGQAAGPFAFGPTSALGFYASQYFNDAGKPTIKNGTYKVTLYGKKLPNGTLQDVKAKSKVFKVNCEAQKLGEKPVKPRGGQILGDAASTEIPENLPATGVSALGALLLPVLSGATYFGVKRFRNRQ